jgi:hypothetical protein
VRPAARYELWQDLADAEQEARDGELAVVLMPRPTWPIMRFLTDPLATGTSPRNGYGGGVPVHRDVA